MDPPTSEAAPGSGSPATANGNATAAKPRATRGKYISKAWCLSRFQEAEGNPSKWDDNCQPSASYTFNISLARTHLRAQGIAMTDSDKQGASSSADRTRPPSPSIHTPLEFGVGSVDPLWLIDEKEAIRLCNLYEVEIGIQYPFLDITRIIENVRVLYRAMASGSQNGFAFTAMPGPTVIDPLDLDLLKMVISAGSIVEAGGSSQLGKALFTGVRKSSHDKLWEPASVKNTMLFVLLAIYSFLTGDDLQAWRLVGVSARWCLEIGLHQSGTVSRIFKEVEARKVALRLFWCVYTLDRRWGFGAGLPFVMHHCDVDRNLPEPDDDVPYLKAMVAYSQIGNKVWSTSYNSARTTGAVRDDEISYLLYLIGQWYEELPDSLKLSPEWESNDWTGSTRGPQRLQLLLHLRANQMKILLLQPILHSPSSLKINKSKVQSLIRFAKDTIQKLNSLNKSTDIYQTQQMCFNHFLVSALGVIFLVVALAPSEYGAAVRDEFHIALDLIRGLSAKSYVSSRLWKMVSDLRLAWRKLGLNPPQTAEDRETRALRSAVATPPPSSSGVDISPHNTTHLAEEDSRAGESEVWQTGAREPISDVQMAQELSDFFNAMDTPTRRPLVNTVSATTMAIADLLQILAREATDRPIEFMAKGLSLVFLVYVVANEFIRSKARLSNFDGPKGLPLIGNLWQVRHDAAEKYREWAKEFGSVFQVQLGNIPVLVINSAAAAKVILGHNSQAIASRPELYTFHKIVANTAGTTIGTSPYNESLKRRRKGAASALNLPAIKTYIPHLDLETKEFLKDALNYGKAGKLPVNPMPLVQRLSLSLAVTLNWGFRFPSHEDPLFKEIIDVEVNISRFRSVTDNLQDYIPLMRWNPFSAGTRAALGMRGRRDIYLSKLNNDLKEKVANGTYEPCIQANVMLDEEAKLNDVELVSISLTMLSAGFETFSTVTTWAIGFLAQHPEIQQKAFDAIKEVYDVNNPLCDANDDQSIPYIRALVRESLRYFTVLRLSLPRATNKDFVFEGKVIPKGTVVFLNSWACNMDTEVWDDPEVFRPERWLENPEAPMFTYGMGYRMCAGTLLANRELYLTFMRMLASFKISTTEVIDSSPLTGVDDKRNLVLAPKPYTVSFTPRNEAALRKALEA
ncbi:Transcriptional activator protein acu-15 [Colletotrichum sp. SAR11_240]|nr:Transcriptional activator protein acu-15 [Colletotrichum sp. SAR11_240]